MKRIVFVQENSGVSAQDRIRGPIYAKAFKQNNVDAVYVGRTPAWPFRIVASRNILIKIIAFFYFHIPGLSYFLRLHRWWNERRILKLSTIADVVYFIKSESSVLPLISKIRKKSNVRIAYDLGDAIWLPAAQGQFREIATILRSVDIVSTDNRISKDYIQKINPKAFIWPPASQTEFAQRKTKLDGKIVLGWLGSPSTVYNLYLIFEVLEKIAKKHSNLELHLLGAGNQTSLIPRFEKLKTKITPYYSAAEMHRIVPTFDIGLFPQYNTEENEAHGITKAVIYMGAGVPCICSPIGVVQDTISDGENGLLAYSSEDWERSLERLISDAKQREAIGNKGLLFAESYFSLLSGVRAVNQHVFE